MAPLPFLPPPGPPTRLEAARTRGRAEERGRKEKRRRRGESESESVRSGEEGRERETEGLVVVEATSVVVAATVVVVVVRGARHKYVCIIRCDLPHYPTRSDSCFITMSTLPRPVPFLRSPFKWMARNRRVLARQLIDLSLESIDRDHAWTLILARKFSFATRNRGGRKSFLFFFNRWKGEKGEEEVGGVRFSWLRSLTLHAAGDVGSLTSPTLLSRGLRKVWGREGGWWKRNRKRR